MNLDKLIHWWLPPVLAWHLGRRAREKRELEAFSRFYDFFLKPGDLCFDIGANLGNRTRCFRHLDCNVIAVEPQTSCFRQLQQEFGSDSGVQLICKAVGREPGRATLHVSPNHVLSTLSNTFIERTLASGRFAKASWPRTEAVQMTTLDQLIAEHGEPKFIKIDVEGFESEVLSGLSRAVPALSIEWTPECADNTRACLRHLMKLGDYEFNLSWGESMRFSKSTWRSYESMLALVDEFEGEAQLFGDIYAKLASAAGPDDRMGRSVRVPE